MCGCCVVKSDKRERNLFFVRMFSLVLDVNKKKLFAHILFNFIAPAFASVVFSGTGSSFAARTTCTCSHPEHGIPYLLHKTFTFMEKGFYLDIHETPVQTLSVRCF